MRLIRSILKLGDAVPALPPLCLTIGNFDGLHLAHQEIIKKVKKISLERNLKSAVLTFEPHPAKLLKSKQAVDFRIFGNAQKIAAFREIVTKESEHDSD
jgi:FAD synthase